MNEILKIVDVKEMGRRMKLVRQRLGMTQTEVGKQLGTTQLMVYRAEKGENILSPLFLAMLLFYSQSVSMDGLLAKNFDIEDESLFTKSYSLNSIVKAKLNGMKDDILGQMAKTQEEMKEQLESTINLL